MSNSTTNNNDSSFVSGRPLDTTSFVSHSSPSAKYGPVPSSGPRPISRTIVSAGPSVVRQASPVPMSQSYRSVSPGPYSSVSGSASYAYHPMSSSSSSSVPIGAAGYMPARFGPAPPPHGVHAPLHSYPLSRPVDVYDVPPIRAGDAYDGGARYMPPRYDPRLESGYISPRARRVSTSSSGYGLPAPVPGPTVASGYGVPAAPPSDSLIREPVMELIDMILAGRALDAFERFYAENCIMSENGENERVGKSTCRAYEQEFLGSINRWNDIKVVSVTIDGNNAAVEWIFDLSFYGGKRVVRRQVAVQTWNKGKIVHEVFYHA